MSGEAENKPVQRAKPATKGSWKRGQSGNPGGRPKIVGEVRALAQRNCCEAIRILVKIAKDVDQLGATRVAACREILDRGIGKPMQSVEVKGDESAAIPMLYIPQQGLAAPEPVKPKRGKK